MSKNDEYSPQLVFVERSPAPAVALTNKIKLSLYKKSVNSGVPANILEEIYSRGLQTWNESFGSSPEQFAFDRVNSFISGGFATMLDEDLLDEKRGLWDNIWAKRRRIARGSGEHMRKPGSKGAPTEKDLKASQNEEVELTEISPEAVGRANIKRIETKKQFKTPEAERGFAKGFKRAWLSTKVGKMKEDYTGSEPVSDDTDEPASRFVGTTRLTQTYADMTPGQKRMSVIKKVVEEAVYHGKNVPLNKPMKGDVKKSKVYVKDPKTGNVKKVNFGDKHLSIKKDIPSRKKSYCARSSGQGNLTDKTKANYWSRKAWSC